MADAEVVAGCPEIQPVLTPSKTSTPSVTSASALNCSTTLSLAIGYMARKSRHGRVLYSAKKENRMKCGTNERDEDYKFAFVDVNNLLETSGSDPNSSEDSLVLIENDLRMLLKIQSRYS